MPKELRLVDPYTKEALKVGEGYYFAGNNKYEAYDLKNSNGKLINFQPSVKIEQGAYSDDHSLTSLANIAPTKRPFPKNYKTKSFGDVLKFVDSPKILMDLGCANCRNS